MERRIVYSGSSKNVYEEVGNKCVLQFEFLDTFSVFDVGVHLRTIPGKGKALCACAVQSFEIAKRLGVRTHFIERVDEVTIRVKRFDISDGRTPISPSSENYLIPLEWIDRSVVAGSLHRDFASGKKKPTDFGFLTDDVPAVGTPLPWPVEQITTKREDFDRPLTPGEALDIGGIAEWEYYRIWSVIHRLNGGLSLAAAQAGFVRLDGKKEVALGEGREVIIVDTFGTPDEDRYAPAQPLRSGEVIHYSKEVIRELFIQNGYFAALEKARKNGQADSPYPQLTDEEIGMAAARYRDFSGWYRAVDLDPVVSPVYVS